MFKMTKAEVSLAKSPNLIRWNNKVLIGKGVQGWSRPRSFWESRAYVVTSLTNTLMVYIQAQREQYYYHWRLYRLCGKLKLHFLPETVRLRQNHAGIQDSAVKTNFGCRRSPAGLLCPPWWSWQLGKYQYRSGKWKLISDKKYTNDKCGLVYDVCMTMKRRFSQDVAGGMGLMSMREYSK